MRKIPPRRVLGLVAVGGGMLLLRPGTRANRVLRHGFRRMQSRSRYLAGTLQGVAYRHRGSAPDPDVPDAVLADRVRSSLGTLEKRLGIPRVHVTVDDHRVTLHGEVGAAEHADAVVAAVGSISGVDRVDSHLQVAAVNAHTRSLVRRSS